MIVSEVLCSGVYYCFGKGIVPSWDFIVITIVVITIVITILITMIITIVITIVITINKV